MFVFRLISLWKADSSTQHFFSSGDGLSCHCIPVLINKAAREKLSRQTVSKLLVVKEEIPIEL